MARLLVTLFVTGCLTAAPVAVASDGEILRDVAAAYQRHREFSKARDLVSIRSEIRVTNELTNQTSVTESVTKRSGQSFLFSSRLLDTTSDPEKTDANYCHGFNGSYYFELGWSQKGSQWFLQGVEECADPAAAAQFMPPHRRKRHLPDAPTAVPVTTLTVRVIDELSEIARFANLKVTHATQDGNVAAIDYSHEVTDPLAPAAGAVTAQCSAKFDAAADLLLVGYTKKCVGPNYGLEVSLDRTVKTMTASTRHTVGTLTVARTVNSKPTERTRTATDHAARSGPVPEAEFTLSAYAMPEPFAVPEPAPPMPPTPTPTPTSVWLAAAGVLLSVAFVILTLLNRRARSRP